MAFQSPPSRIFARTFSLIMGACLAVILLLAVGTFLTLDGEYNEDVEEKLLNASVLLVSSIEQEATVEDALPLCEDFARRTNIRTTIISRTQGLLYDSEQMPSGAKLKAFSPEVNGALAGNQTFLKRPSYILGTDMFYLALPFRKTVDEKTAYCIRLGLPAGDLKFARDAIARQMLLLLVCAIVLATVFSFVIAKKAGNSINKLRMASRQFAAGNLEWEVDKSGLSEMIELGDAMKDMARQLKARIESVDGLNIELNEIFSIMSEPLFICAQDGSILRMNKTAMDFFSEYPALGKFRKYTDVFKEEALLEAIAKSFKTSEPVHANVKFKGPNALSIEMALLGIQMPADKSGMTRRLFVMHDISAIRALEKQRREFVASATHELRTPITSILGAAETMCDSDNLNDVKRFAGIIERAATRMNLLVDDMVLLARIESDESQKKKFFRECDVSKLIADAVSIHEIQSDHHGDTIVRNYPDEIIGWVDPTLLTMAVSNLVDNAIKYNPDGTTIEISTERDGDMLEISVADNGSGIDPKYTKRIFERFFRCESGRALNPAGSGIGLAIVKHIAIMHNGNALISSELGKGSTFTITISLESPK